MGDVNHKNERPKMRNTNQSHNSESQEQNMEEKMRRLEKDIVNLRQENERLNSRQLQEYLNKLASDGYLRPENLDLVLQAVKTGQLQTDAIENLAERIRAKWVGEITEGY